jgi:hypothetical protein
MVLIKDPPTPLEEYIPKIFYAGIFDYDKLMRAFAQWYNEMGYEFHEENFKHKVPSPSGSEQEWKLNGWRKVTEYVMYWVRVEAHIWELKDIDVVINGEKKKMSKGKVMICLRSEIYLDYNNKFNTSTTEKIQKFLNNFVWHKQITGGWSDECYYRMYKLHRIIKETLGMSTITNASEIRY